MNQSLSWREDILRRMYVTSAVRSWESRFNTNVGGLCDEGRQGKLQRCMIAPSIIGTNEVSPSTNALQLFTSSYDIFADSLLMDPWKSSTNALDLFCPKMAST